MPETLSLPVLPLDDTIVLPTMVVPVDTSGTEVARGHRGGSAGRVGPRLL